jgi:hypothetical protein
LIGLSASKSIERVDLSGEFEPTDLDVGFPRRFFPN